jgi:hypothetical protein
VIHQWTTTAFEFDHSYFEGKLKEHLCKHTFKNNLGDFNDRIQLARKGRSNQAEISEKKRTHVQEMFQKKSTS